MLTPHSTPLFHAWRTACPTTRSSMSRWPCHVQNSRVTSSCPLHPPPQACPSWLAGPSRPCWPPACAYHQLQETRAQSREPGSETRARLRHGSESHAGSPRTAKPCANWVVKTTAEARAKREAGSDAKVGCQGACSVFLLSCFDSCRCSYQEV